MNQPSFEDSLRNSQLQQIVYNKKKESKILETSGKQQTQEEQELNSLLQIVNPLLPVMRAQRKSVAEGKLDFLFNPARDIQTARSYIEDGDTSLYTQETLRERSKLKQDPDVISAINNFINYYKFDQKGKLVKEEYIRVQIRIIYLLRDDLIEDENIDELKFTIDQDWDHDSLGKGFMNKEDLFKSLFELVDIWTPNIDKQEYIGFFELLNEKFEHQPKDKLEKKFWDIIGDNFVC